MPSPSVSTWVCLAKVKYWLPVKSTTFSRLDPNAPSGTRVSVPSKVASLLTINHPRSVDARPSALAGTRTRAFPTVPVSCAFQIRAIRVMFGALVTAVATAVLPLLWPHTKKLLSAPNPFGLAVLVAAMVLCPIVTRLPRLTLADCFWSRAGVSSRPMPAMS